MAGTDRQTTDPLIAELQAEPCRFDFYRAVRLLQSEFRDFPRVGCSQTLAGDPVRFAQSPSLAFPPSTLEAVQRRGSDGQLRVFARHFGLFGPNGPLPLHLTEYAQDRLRHHGDRTFAEFCNVFHHRLASFFFRAWADARKELDLDRPADQRWAFYVGSLVGLGMESLQHCDAIPDWAKFFYAGRLAPQPRNAEGLGAILRDYFAVAVAVLPFVGRWLDVPADSACRLGESPRSGSLGATAIVGARVWDCQLTFRLRVGPVGLRDFLRFLPGQAAFARLAEWVKIYTHDQLFWDLQLVLRKEEVPETRLGSAGRLGWTTWLRTQAMDHDSDDLVLVTPSAP